MHYNKLSLVLITALFSTMLSAAAAPQKLKGIPYVGAQVGYGGANTPELNITGMHTKIHDGVALGIEAGYLFNISHNFKLGPEFGYKSYPNNTYKSDIPYQGDTLNVTYSGHYFDLLANAEYYFKANWSLFTKVGAAAVTQEETDDKGTRKGKKDNNAIFPQLVFGVGYHFTPQMSVNLSFDHVFGSTIPDESVGDVSSKKVASITTYMLGFTYSFA